jgi:hypothetical protein
MKMERYVHSPDALRDIALADLDRMHAECANGRALPASERASLIGLPLALDRIASRLLNFEGDVAHARVFHAAAGRMLDRPIDDGDVRQADIEHAVVNWELAVQTLIHGVSTAENEGRSRAWTH